MAQQKEGAEREPHPDGVVIVYRWRVEDQHLPEFLSLVMSLAQRVERSERWRKTLTSWRLMQPVFGPAGDIVELHLGFDDFATAGKALDSLGLGEEGMNDLSTEVRTLANGIRSSLQAELGLFGSGTSVAELLEISAPLYRHWQWLRPDAVAPPS